MLVKTRLPENTTPQSSCLVNLVFGLLNWLVNCEMNSWKVSPLDLTMLL